MKKLTCIRTIRAPRELCFEMIRNVEAHAAAVPAIRARAEAGCRKGPLCVGNWTRWSAVYFGVRFRLTLEATECDWPVRYVETARPGLFRHFQHDYLFVVKNSEETVVKDLLSFEGGPGIAGRWIDSIILAPRLQKALDQRMDSIKQWCEDGTWKQWIPETELKQLISG